LNPDSICQTGNNSFLSGIFDQQSTDKAKKFVFIICWLEVLRELPILVSWVDALRGAYAVHAGRTAVEAPAKQASPDAPSIQRTEYSGLLFA
jgi:hypothetical protein